MAYGQNILGIPLVGRPRPRFSMGAPIEATAESLLLAATYSYDFRGMDPAAISDDRSTIAWHDNLAGIWSSFAPTVPRITDRGIRVEPVRNNFVLHCRDLTNAVWVKTNITAAKDQTGIDGVSNSASRITASAGNGTCLQTTVSANQLRNQSAWVKRLVGSGVIEMTQNNGTTWTPITVTAGWTCIRNIPPLTSANPVVGFRIVTSGDSIAVDFVQNEEVSTTSPILTTTAIVTRTADHPFITPIVLPAAGYTMLAQGISEAPAVHTSHGKILGLDAGSATERCYLQREGGTLFRYMAVMVIANSNRYSKSSAIDDLWTQFASRKIVCAIKASDQQAYHSPGSVKISNTGTWAGTPTAPTHLRIGYDISGIGQFHGVVEAIHLWNTCLLPADMILLTAS